MNKENLVIINNEKVFSDNGNFFCENLDLKVVPEGLNNFFNVRFIVRKSNKKGNQKINLRNIDIAPNIFSFILFVIKSLKNNSKYLIISITPYTFLAYIILFIFNKKVFLYLWSDGHEEWKYLLGKWSVWIFRIMYVICTFRSEIIICNKRLSKKKSHLISISRLDENNQNNVKDYKKIVSETKGLGKIKRVFKNFLKIIFRVGYTKWSNVIHQKLNDIQQINSIINNQKIFTEVSLFGQIEKKKKIIKIGSINNKKINRCTKIIFKCKK